MNCTLDMLSFVNVELFVYWNQVTEIILKVLLNKVAVKTKLIKNNRILNLVGVFSSSTENYIMQDVQWRSVHILTADRVQLGDSKNYI